MKLTAKARTFWILAVVVLAADIITKHLILATLEIPHQSHQVVGDFIRFTLSFNRGAAFGMTLFGAPRWFFVALTIVILGVLWMMFREASDSDKWQGAALGMIVGGALGNLYDRVRWDMGVVDFIDVGIGVRRFWTFNVADSGITVGAVLMVLLLLLQSVQQKRAQTRSSEGG